MHKKMVHFRPSENN